MEVFFSIRITVFIYQKISWHFPDCKFHFLKKNTVLSFQIPYNPIISCLRAAGAIFLKVKRFVSWKYHFPVHLRFQIENFRGPDGPKYWYIYRIWWRFQKKQGIQHFRPFFFSNCRRSSLHGWISKRSKPAFNLVNLLSKNFWKKSKIFFSRREIHSQRWGRPPEPGHRPGLELECTPVLEGGPIFESGFLDD